MMKIAIHFYKILGLIVTLILWTFFPVPRGKREVAECTLANRVTKIYFLQNQIKTKSKSKNLFLYHDNFTYLKLYKNGRKKM